MTSHRIPVGGYPSIKRAVNDMLDKGWRREDIIKELGITSIQYKTAIKCSVYFQISCAAVDGLEPYAEARKMPVSTLIRYLIETIVRYDMVDNILDDKAEEDRKELKKHSKKIRDEFIMEHYRKNMRAKDIRKVTGLSIGRISEIYRRNKNASKAAAS